MVDKPRIRLHNVSVVVTAEFHNPSILNPDFLEKHGIVPENWAVTETVTTPTASVVKYANGVAWTVDPSRLTVSEDLRTGVQKGIQDPHSGRYVPGPASVCTLSRAWLELPGIHTRAGSPALAC